ncbi:MAG: hypothetical protein IJT73_00715 [Selenomonadaceae bacterium]|nr:hypothetical protein [Selenomonadaceae bacterium]
MQDDTKILVAKINGELEEMAERNAQLQLESLKCYQSVKAMIRQVQNMLTPEQFQTWLKDTGIGDDFKDLERRVLRARNF